MSQSIFSILIFSLILSANVSWAHIPEAQMIMSRTAENHGRGVYEIEQDVVFQVEPEPITVRETWLVDGENSLRLKAEGRGPLAGRFYYSALYKGKQRFISQGAQTKAGRMPSDWFEHFFNFRYSKNLRQWLTEWKMIDNKASESSLRLARVGGSIAYAFGDAAQSGQSTLPAGLWVEQDQFVVRKLRLPSQVTIRADDYVRYPLALYLGRNKTISWDKYSVQVRVNQVQSFGRSKDKAQLLELARFRTEKASQELPEIEVLKEFYTRFR